jgi:hypothetical protein
MTAINFPDSPSNGDTHTSGNTSYTYQSAKARWVAVSSSGSGSADGVTSNFTANGAITAYDPVVINTDGTISSVGIVTSGSNSTASNHGHQDSTAVEGVNLNYDTENDQWVLFGGYGNDTYLGRYDSNGDFEWDVGPLSIGGGNWGDYNGRLVYDPTLETYLIVTYDLTDNRLELHQATITSSGYTVSGAGWVAGPSVSDETRPLPKSHLVGTSKVSMAYLTTNKYPAISTATAASNGGFTLGTELVLNSFDQSTSGTELLPYDVVYHANSGKMIAVYVDSATVWKYSVVDVSGTTPSIDSSDTFKTIDTGTSAAYRPRLKLAIEGDKIMAFYQFKSANLHGGYPSLRATAGVINSSTGVVTWGTETIIVASNASATNMSSSIVTGLHLCSTLNGHFALLYAGLTTALEDDYFIKEYSVDSSGDMTLANSTQVTQNASKAQQNRTMNIAFDPDANKLLVGLGTSTSSYGISNGTWRINTFLHTPQYTAPSATNSARYIGVAGSGISDLASGSVTLSGKQSGFTGLTAGTEYYLTDNGGLSSTATDKRKIGIAVSSTDILLR